MNRRRRSRTLSVSSAAVPAVSQLGADPMSPFSGGFGARSRRGTTAAFVSAAAASAWPRSSRRDRCLTPEAVTPAPRLL